MNKPMKIRSSKETPDAIIVDWDGGTRTTYPFIWLRDNDPGELHPDTGERTFDLTRVELDIRPVHHTLENNSL